MTRYEYRCDKCGDIKIAKLEQSERNTLNGLLCESEECKGRYQRVISAVNFTVKGFNAKNGYSKSKDK